jgi:hypothetical protein
MFVAPCYWQYSDHYLMMTKFTLHLIHLHQQKCFIKTYVNNLSKSKLDGKISMFVGIGSTQELSTDS